MKHTLGLLTALLLGPLVALQAVEPSASPASAPKPAGLTKGPNATVLRDGKPYRGIGVNYFDCFLRTLSNGDNTSYEAGFATLAAKGIPFARFCATGFWPRDMKLYQTDRAEYFRRLDGVVKSAEKNGIGLVPSLFWYHACVPDLVGEPMDQWGNPQSKTHAWMREYVREIVTRYRDHPTIWAWEMGNEFSLAASLPNAKDHRPKTHADLGTPATRSERDDLTFAMLRVAFAEFGKAVREHDAGRLILTGDSFPRLSAWHQENENKWTSDTPEQFAEILTLANPDPISAISLHAYDADDQRFATAMEVSRKLDKPLFIGEFGVPEGTPGQAEKFRSLLKAIGDHDIPLAALWVFDLKTQKEWSVTAENARAWQLDLISEANKRRAHKPLIGIASLTDANYVRAIREAGGIPVVLPNTDGSTAIIDEYLASLDGLLLPGGADIPPSEWNEQPHPTTKILDNDRYRFEKALAAAWIKRTRKPLLGICLGSQWINVAHGGSLVQDIPSEFNVIHRDTTHQVALEPDSKLAGIFGSTNFDVNSHHHQAVRKLGEGLRVVAKSPDGIVEATETTDPNRFLIGVQWHPEKLIQSDSRQQKLFKAFIAASSH